MASHLKSSLIFTFAVAVAAGCASDPNKEATSAHNAELKTERKQLEEHADNRGDQREQAATDQRKYETATATTPSNTADAKMTEARVKARSKATERIEKLDAKIAELRAIVDRAGAKATTESRDSLKTVDTQHAQVDRELNGLAQVPNDNFEQAKDSLDARINELEGVVKKTSNEVDKFKKN